MLISKNFMYVYIYKCIKQPTKQQQNKTRIAAEQLQGAKIFHFS